MTAKDDIANNQFFVTPSHACSYLDNREATTLFLDPRETISASGYQLLSENGFRRSGGHLYRPHCKLCSACMATRIPVMDFAPKRRQRRTLNRNQDLVISLERADYTPSVYALYERYIEARHHDGDMYPPSADQFRSFLLSQWADTFFLCSYLGTELVAVAVTDRQPRGLSAIYTFFEPELESRSLGAYSILQQIKLCERWAVPYLYLGYWIRDSAKMRYKLDYRPVEVLTNGRWIKMT